MAPNLGVAQISLLVPPASYEPNRSRISHTVYEKNLLLVGKSDTGTNTSSVQPRRLTINLLYSVPNQSFVHSDKESSLDSISWTNQQPSENTFGTSFEEGEAMLNKLHELEAAHVAARWPILASSLSQIECSQLSKHIWSHTKTINLRQSWSYTLRFSVTGVSKYILVISGCGREISWGKCTLCINSM